MKGWWESNINVLFPFMYSQKGNRAASLFPKQNHNVLSPNSCAHISGRDLYISRISLSILLQPKYLDRSWEYINRSQTHECGNWDWCRAIPRKGINKWDFRCSAVCRMLFMIVVIFLNLLQLSENLFSHMSQEEQRELALQYSSGDSQVKVMQFCLFFINFLFLYNKQ